MRALDHTLGLDYGITPFRPDWVVPLQTTGQQRPLFVFPASHSDPALRRDAEIARFMGHDRPVWGLAHRDSHRDLVRQAGVAALGAEYAAQIRALQPAGPYLLFGNCMGGHLAWETASQLLALGDQVADICFFEAPLRADFANVRPGPIPVETTSVWRLGHYYAPPALPVHLTHIMTPEWQRTRWWRPWQGLALGGMRAVTLPDDGTTSRAQSMAEAIQAWCHVAEASRMA